jgi:hypothetical protein
MEDSRFNDLGSDFDDLFDNEGAVTVENLDKKDDSDSIEVSDSLEEDSEPDYGVVEETDKSQDDSSGEELDV